MKDSKKTSHQSTMTSDPDDQLIGEFADVLSESVLDAPGNPEEPFETYAQQVRGHLHVNEDRFRSRFTKGYHALIEELKSH